MCVYPVCVCVCFHLFPGAHFDLSKSQVQHSHSTPWYQCLSEKLILVSCTSNVSCGRYVTSGLSISFNYVMKWLSLAKEYFGHPRGGGEMHLWMGVPCHKEGIGLLPRSIALPWRDDGTLADPHYFFVTPLLGSWLYIWSNHALILYLICPKGRC